MREAAIIMVALVSLLAFMLACDWYFTRLPKHTYVVDVVYFGDGYEAMATRSDGLQSCYFSTNDEAAIAGCLNGTFK